MPTAKENRTLTIEGDLVRVQRTVVEREVKTSDFVAEIARMQPLDTGPLPAGCVSYTRCESKKNRVVSVYVIERPAGMQPIRLKTTPPDKDEVITDLALSWPVTLWFVRCIGDAIQNLHLTCTRTPAAEQGRDTKLHSLLMPNQYDFGHGAVCLGNLVLQDGVPLVRRVEKLVRQTVESLWNADLMPSFDGTGITDLENWAAHSAANPEFHTQIKFPEHRQQTVGTLLTHLLDSPE